MPFLKALAQSVTQTHLNLAYLVPFLQTKLLKPHSTTIDDETQGAEQGR